MSQSTMNLANQAGAAYRAAVNAALQALAGINSGATAPTETYPYMMWADTASDVLKIRNAANTAWISFMTPSTGKPLGVALSGANSDITSLSAVSSINGGALAGLRNRLINGDMRVAQRATLSTTTAQGYSTVDRWYCDRAGSVAGLTMSQVYGAFGTNKYCLSLQRDSGNTSTAVIDAYQVIEGMNCRDMAGKTVTLSFRIGTGTSVTASGHSAELFYQTTTTDIGPAGAWTSIGGQAFTVAAATSLTAKSFQFAVPAGATQLMVKIVLAVSGTAGADDRFYLTEAQLETGSVATPFETRPYGMELALCQRYYEKSFDDSTVPAIGVVPGRIKIHNLGAAAADTTTNITFKVNKRVAPSMTAYAQSGATASFDNIGLTGGNMFNSALAAGAVTYQHWTASSEL